MTNNNGHGNGISWVKEYWSLILALILIAGTWATIGLRLDNLEAHVEKHDTRFESVDSTFTTLQVTLGRVESDLAWIRVTLEELKTRGD